MNEPLEKHPRLGGKVVEFYGINVRRNVGNALCLIIPDPMPNTHRDESKNRPHTEDHHEQQNATEVFHHTSNVRVMA